MAVVIDSGPVAAEDLLRHVPQDKWRELMLARRRFLDIEMSHDCRCLVQFVDDAKVMHSALGFSSPEEMVSVGYGLVPDEIGVALEWLRLNPPSEPLPLIEADRIARAARAAESQRRDQEDRENQRPAHRPKTLDSNGDDIKGFPSGTSAAYALRRLRKDRPDIHARVLAGELTAHAGMIDAGFRKKPVRKKLTAFDRIIKLLPQLTPDERRKVAEAITEQNISKSHPSRADARGPAAHQSPASGD